MCVCVCVCVHLECVCACLNYVCTRFYVSVCVFVLVYMYVCTYLCLLNPGVSEILGVWSKVLGCK